MDETKDLQLLDQAMLKFTLADDSQFERLTGNLLSLIVEKLSTASTTIRNKVLKIIQFINQRFNAEPKWQLPYESLLSLLGKLQPSDALTSNFTLAYIISATTRMEPAEKETIILRLLKSMNTLSSGCQQHILSNFIGIVDAIKARGMKEKRMERFEFLLDPHIRSALVKFSKEFLLYVIGHKAGKPSNGHSIESENALTNTPLSGIQEQMPGANQVPRIGKFTTELLCSKKVGLVQFFIDNVDLFEPSELYIPALLASCDGFSSVSEKGDFLVKALPREVLENKDVVTSLYQLILGDQQTSQQQQQQQQQQQVGTEEDIPPSKRSPIGIVLRLQVLEALTRSAKAASMFPQSLLLLYSTLFSKYLTDPKIKKLGLAFAQWSIRISSEASIKSIATTFFPALMKFFAWLKEDNIAFESLKPEYQDLQLYTLHCLTALGKRYPKIFSSHSLFFEELMADLNAATEPTWRSTIQETLTSICPAYINADPSVKQKIKDILSKNFQNIHKSPLAENAMDATPTLGSSNSNLPAGSSSTLTAAAQNISFAAQYVCQFYANRAFPYSDHFCRYINLLGSAEVSKTVAQEAQLGLKPYSVIDNEIIHIETKANSYNSATSDPDDDSIDTQSSEFAGDKEKRLQVNTAKKTQVELPSLTATIELLYSKRNVQSGPFFPSKIFKNLVTFISSLFELHRSQFSTSSNSMDIDISATPEVKDNALQTMNKLISIFLDSLTASSVDLSYESSQVLLRFLQFEPIANFASNRQIPTLPEDLQLLKLNPLSIGSNKTILQSLRESISNSSLQDETMKNIARVICLCIDTTSLEDQSILEDVFTQLNSSVFSLRRLDNIGRIYTLGFSISSFLRKKLVVPNLKAYVDWLHKTIQAALLDASPTSVQNLSCCLEALGTVARWTPLSTFRSSEDTPTVSDSVISCLKHAESHVVVIASSTLASLRLGDPLLPNVNSNYFNALFDTNILKSEESHFTIGDSLAISAFGWNSPVASDSLLPSLRQDEIRIMQEQSSEINGLHALEAQYMKTALHKILQEYLLSSRYTTRMPSAIWLLSIVKNCGTHPEIISQLKQIQIGFGQLLSDSNRVLQEVAGKGLAIVYELGDDTTKKELVDSLVTALQKGGSTFKVTAETQVFQEGEIGTTPTGEKLTTYRELVNMASEMGKPELIYKFMNISAHNTLWNSKKGAAYATGELAIKARSQIQEYLPQMLPKLYRSSFDPNQGVSNAMRDLITQIVPNLPSALTKYFSPIMVELLDTMYHNQWRLRESSCLAIADILGSRTYQQVAPHLSELWTRCYRTLDDIKESVRKAAEALNKSLSTLMVRLCDPSYTRTEDGKAALAVALPFLTSKGIVSPVKEVAATSIQLLVRLTKVASFLLKPHVSSLIPALISAMAAAEPTELNYLEQHASRFGVSQETFDSVRIGISKGSPNQIVIDFCVQQVDTENVIDLVQKLSPLLTSENPIAVRASCASVITQIALTRSDACQVVAHKLLLALKKGISARSEQIRKAFGYALGQVARWAKPKSIETIVNSLVESYKSAAADDNDTRAAVGEALLELSKVSASQQTAKTSQVANTSNSNNIKTEIDSTTNKDHSKPSSSNTSSASPVLSTFESPKSDTIQIPILKPFYNLLMPLVFLARFDSNAATSKVFDKVWEECGTSLALYVPETVKTLSVALESSSWNMKKQSAKAISKLAESLNAAQFIDQAPSLLSLLMSSIKGRTWDGKESLLAALASLITSIAPLWSDLKDSSKVASIDDIFNLVLTEVQKKKLEYKRDALDCLKSVIAAFEKSQPDFHAFGKICSVIIPLTTSVHESTDNASSTINNNNNKSTTEQEEESAISKSIRLIAMQTLTFAFSSTNSSQTDANTLIEVYTKVFTTSLYNIKISVLNAAKLMVSKVPVSKFAETLDRQALTVLLVDILLVGIVDPKFSSVRQAAANALNELLIQAGQNAVLSEFAGEITLSVQNSLEIGPLPNSERLLNLVSSLSSVSPQQ